jgi:twitching motility protein PilT
MLSESLRGVIAQTLCRKIGGGRVAALEVLIATQAVSNLIREGKTFQIQSVLQAGVAAGMVTMEGSLRALWERGYISSDDAMEHAMDAREMSRLLGRGERR